MVERLKLNYEGRRSTKGINWLSSIGWLMLSVFFFAFFLFTGYAAVVIASEKRWGEGSFFGFASILFLVTGLGMITWACKDLRGGDR